MTEIQIAHNDGTPWALSEDRVPVFSVVRPNPDYAPDAPGEQTGSRTITKTYTMPAKTNAGLALKYLRMARVNADTAASWLLEEAIGADGYDALVEELENEPDAKKAEQTMTQVIQTVAQRALGGLGKA